MKRRLDVLGQPVVVEATLPEGDSPAAALFEPARAISESITRVVLGRMAARGVAPSCREACAACCAQLVPISAVEAVRIASVVGAMPPARAAAVRKRFAEVVKRLERAGLVDRDAPAGRASMTVAPREGESAWDAVSRRYRALSLACPLLESSRCSVYADRPLVCREYLVSSPAEACARAPDEVVALPRPVRMSEVLADAANAALGTDVPSIPLPLALEWAEHHGASLEASRAGDALADTLLSCIDVEDEDS